MVSLLLFTAAADAVIAANITRPIKCVFQYQSSNGQHFMRAQFIQSPYQIRKQKENFNFITNNKNTAISYSVCVCVQLLHVQTFLSCRQLSNLALESDFCIAARYAISLLLWYCFAKTFVIFIHSFIHLFSLSGCGVGGGGV